MAALLKLKDDNETVNFIYDASTNLDFALEDKSFIMATPEKVELRSPDNFFAGKNLLRQEYGPRQVSFRVRVMGTTQLALSNNISKIQRLLTRASSATYLQGGAYNQDAQMIEGSDTGDQGVILQIRRGSDTLTAIASELNNNSTAVTGLYTLRVIQGDLEVTDNIFGSADQMGKPTSDKYFRNCAITLQCEPFIIGVSRLISTAAAPAYANAPDTSHLTRVNRLFIPAASVPGDVEALTRISTQLSGATGVIIARDAGISLLNCPSYPTLSTGKNDMFVYGQVPVATTQIFKVNINGTGTPNTFRFSNDNGSTWGTTTNIVAWTPIQLRANSGLIEAYAIFGSTTGFTSNQTWTFSNHQSYLPGTSSVDAYANREDFMSDSGAVLHTISLNVPPGCRSRYKVIVEIGSTITCEYKMQVNYIIRTGPTTALATQPQSYEWVGPYTSRLIDLGIIDLTSVSNPFMSHPYSMCVLQIAIYARTYDEITGGSPTAQVIDAHLVPCQDEFAHMQAAWKVDGAGHEVYSNYDAANPYIAEETANLFDADDLRGRTAVGLDATYGGNVITLIPNIDQTLCFIPLLSTSSDWRAAILPVSTSPATTGDTYVAIRPRYLHLPA